MKKIPVRMYSLKTVYNNIGMNWISTREFRDLGVSKAHMYELRGELEQKLWHETMRNRNGSKVYAEGAQKIGNYWRVSAKGLLALHDYFEIADENLREVAQKLLIGEEV